MFWRRSRNSAQVAATSQPGLRRGASCDDVVVNLTAFETFFPEKRLFFLEGNEVFITTPRSRDVFRRAGRLWAAHDDQPTVGRPPPCSTPVASAERQTSRCRTSSAPRALNWAVPFDLRGRRSRRPSMKAHVALRIADRLRGRCAPGGGAGRRLHPSVSPRTAGIFAVARLLYEASVRWPMVGVLPRHPDPPSRRRRRGAGHADVAPAECQRQDRLGCTAHGQRRRRQQGRRRSFTALAYVPSREWRHSASIDYVDAGLDIADPGFTSSSNDGQQHPLARPIQPFPRADLSAQRSRLQPAGGP